MEGYSQDNPLSLPRDAQGRVHHLRLDELEGDGRDRRLNVCTTFCGILNGLPNGVTAFNNLTQPQQIIAVRIRKNDTQHPPRVLEHYLQAPPEFREVAITSSEHNAENSSILIKELALGHIAEYFR